MAYDMSQVTDRLWIGANINSTLDVHEIRRAGITHVIDCNTDDETPYFPSHSGIALLSAPTDDDGLPKTSKWFEPIIDFGVGALAHPGFSVLTHCAAGINRGPSAAYAILRAVSGIDEEAILNLIHETRTVTCSGIRYWKDAEKSLSELRWIK